MRKLSIPRYLEIPGYVVAGVALLATLVAINGGNPAAAPGAWIHGAFGTAYALTQTLTAAAPLVLIALGASVPLRAGVIVVGAESQMILGALAATVVLQTPLGAVSPLVALPAGALAGAAGGALWSLLPAQAQVRRGVPEVLTAIMVNLATAVLLAYLLRTALADPAGSATPRSAYLPDPALLPLLPVPGRLTVAVPAVLLFAGAAMWWHRSRAALLLDVYAQRHWLGARNGIGPRQAVVLPTLVSGAAAGLAGWMQLAGTTGRLTPAIAGGIGFSGLVVAVLGRNRPIPIVLAAIVLAALTSGANGLQMVTGTPAAIGTVTQAILLILVALTVVALRRRAARRTAAPVQEDDAGG